MRLLIHVSISIQNPVDFRRIWNSNATKAEDILCPCGNPGHTNLEKWYDGYRRFPWDVREEVSNDKLNEVALEEKIQRLLVDITVVKGYCLSCQNLLDHWPEIVQKASIRDAPPFHVQAAFQRHFGIGGWL